MGAAASLLQARYNHTAVLLKDGRVWFAGGRNPAIVATGDT
ncbi:MAG: kelch motif-containing protein [Elusimicrobiota bacterium]|nr:MAG: kelch motif-containing protein [Elusimicrobiota bacterium]